MKILIPSTIFFLMLAATAAAQSTPQYTQFFFNKLIYNPGYAGSKEVLATSLHYRHQWDGIDGAPRTGTVAAHMPFLNNRCGIGISITNDRIAFLETNFLRFSYSYRVPIKKNRSTLAIGLQGIFQYDQYNWENAEVIEFADDSIPFGQTGGSNGNFGLGLYYSSSKFYAGVSMPQFFDGAGLKALATVANFDTPRTYFIMAGIVLPVNPKLMIKPALLTILNPNLPMGLEINVSALLMETIWLGFTYRFTDSMDAIFQYQFNKRWRAGVSYDLTISSLSQYGNGSAEFILEYLFDQDKDKLKNLRFF